MLVGDRENEILREIQRESYDLFVEGLLHSFTTKKLYDKFNSRLYKHIPCPVIIVKNLVNVEKIALIVRSEIEPKRLVSLFLNIFINAKIKLDLIFCEFQEPGQLSYNAKKETNGTLSAVEKMLAENQCPPENCLTIQGAPEEIGDALRDYGLIACPFYHTISKKSNWFQLLSHIPSPILICWQ